MSEGEPLLQEFGELFLQPSVRDALHERVLEHKPFQLQHHRFLVLELHCHKAFVSDLLVDEVCEVHASFVIYVVDYFLEVKLCLEVR